MSTDRENLTKCRKRAAEQGNRIATLEAALRRLLEQYDEALTDVKSLRSQLIESQEREKEGRENLHEARRHYTKQGNRIISLEAALSALTMWSPNGEQLCFRTHKGIPMGMSKEQERLARAALTDGQEP